MESVIQKYDIQPEDTYNMDEKGFALGVAGRVKVICSQDDLQVYATQDGNREWVSLIECISADRKLLEMFIIFKSVSSGVSLAATVGVRHKAVPRSSRMRLSVSMEAKHTLPPIRLSMTAYLGHATMGP